MGFTERAIYQFCRVGTDQGEGVEIQNWCCSKHGHQASSSPDGIFCSFVKVSMKARGSFLSFLQAKSSSSPVVSQVHNDVAGVVVLSSLAIMIGEARLVVLSVPHDPLREAVPERPQRPTRGTIDTHLCKFEPDAIPSHLRFNVHSKMETGSGNGLVRINTKLVCVSPSRCTDFSQETRSTSNYNVTRRLH